MAAAWLRKLAGDRVAVYSAGSEPASTLNPAAVESMAEVGIDITGNNPQRWSDEMIQSVDVVVTMGCGDTCPVFPGVRYADWDVADPSGWTLESVRPVRDDIKQRVEHLIRDLDVDFPQEA